MKPHRLKHMKEKAIRQNNRKDLAERTSSQQAGAPVQMKLFKDPLKPLNVEHTRFILNYFVKHWEREKIVHLRSFHGSKRTTPGEVEGDGPYMITQNIPAKHWESKNLAKRNDIDRKMIKIQNQHHKKAA